MRKPSLLTLTIESQKDGDQFVVTLPVAELFFDEIDNLETAIENGKNSLLELIRKYREV